MVDAMDSRIAVGVGWTRVEGGGCCSGELAEWEDCLRISPRRGLLGAVGEMVVGRAMATGEDRDSSKEAKWEGLNSIEPREGVNGEASGEKEEGSSRSLCSGLSASSLDEEASVEHMGEERLPRIDVSCFLTMSESIVVLIFCNTLAECPTQWVISTLWSICSLVT